MIVIAFILIAALLAALGYLAVLSVASIRRTREMNRRMSVLRNGVPVRGRR